MRPSSHPGNYDADTIKAWEDTINDGIMQQGRKTGKMGAIAVKFSWTATVAVDGTVTGTPFTIDAVVDPDVIDVKLAQTFDA